MATMFTLRHKHNGETVTVQQWFGGLSTDSARRRAFKTIRKEHPNAKVRACEFNDAPHKFQGRIITWADDGKNTWELDRRYRVSAE